MNNQRQMDERLWDLIDGLCPPEERSAVEGLIASHREWQLRYKELLEVHETLSGAELEEPSLRFTRNVMDEIARYQVAPATKSYINKNIVRGLAAFFLVLIAGLLIWCLGQFHWRASGTSSPLIAQYSQELQEHLDKFDWSKLFNNTYLQLFLMVNVILGLIFLDKVLQRRRRQYSNKDLEA
jgi:anti-sigma factor RsiW